MKRLLCLILAATMMITLVACGKDIDDSYVDGSVGETTQDTQDTSNSDVTEEVPAGPQYPFDLSFIEDNGIAYIWERLDEKTRYNLGEVMNAIMKVEIYCSLTEGMSKEEFNDFLELVSNTAMGYTYVGNKFKGHVDESGKVIGITIPYDINYEEEGAQRTQLVKEAVKKAVEGMPDGTDYEKLKYLHDYLVLNCDYNTDAQSPFTAYGALVEGKATCQGYADAMHLLLAGAGFETVFATGVGDLDTVKHKWNYVKCSDGKWYIIDPTWDDPEGKEDKTYIGYDYFMISEEMLLRDHKETFESKYYELPVADSMDLNYHIMSGYYAETYDEAVEILKSQAKERVENGDVYVYLRCANKEIFDEVNSKVFSGDYVMQDILVDVKAETGADIITNSWKKVLKEDICTITVTIKYEE